MFGLIRNTASGRGPQPALLQLFLGESVTSRPCDQLRAATLMPSARTGGPGRKAYDGSSQPGTGFSITPVGLVKTQLAGLTPEFLSQYLWARPGNLHPNELPEASAVLAQLLYFVNHRANNAGF